jgi:hypothetical protein
MPYRVADGAYDPEYCPSCLRSAASNEATQLCHQVRELVDGTGPFEWLTMEERQEQLAQLGIVLDVARNAADAPDAATRDELESRLEAQDEDDAMDALNVYETDLG